LWDGAKRRLRRRTRSLSLEREHIDSATNGVWLCRAGTRCWSDVQLSQEDKVTTHPLQGDHASSPFVHEATSAVHSRMETKISHTATTRVQAGSQPSPEALARLVGMHTAAAAAASGGTPDVSADETLAAGVEVREDGAAAAATTAASKVAVAARVAKARADAAATVRDPTLAPTPALPYS